MNHKDRRDHENRVRKFLKNARRKTKNERANFYRSLEWKKLRYKAFKKYGNQCMCCGATPADGYILHVDHIKPMHRHPELSLDINNLQILCATCNHGKYGEDETDWRNHMKEIIGA